MSTIREGLCSQSGKGQWTREEQKEQAPPQSRSVPPSVVLRHQRHANAGEQAQFSKSASLGGCFLLCHEITRVKETCVFVLASCGAKSLRCAVSHQSSHRGFEMKERLDSRCWPFTEGQWVLRVTVVLSTVALQCFWKPGGFGF